MLVFTKFNEKISTILILFSQSETKQRFDGI